MTKIEFIKLHAHFKEVQIVNTIKLFEEGGTIPFISRYRKEQTQNLDEEQIEKIQLLSNQFDQIEKRKNFILNSIEEKKKLTEALAEKIKSCFDLLKLEDYYLPYKTSRVTKADKALKAGLGAFAAIIMKQDNGDPKLQAGRFQNKEYPTPDEVIDGAIEIIANWINENEIVREKLRSTFFEHGVLTAKVVKSKLEVAENYKDYFDVSQRIIHCPAHRLMAILRGESEGILKVKIEPNVEFTMNWLNRFYVKNNNENSKLVQNAIERAYKKSLQPSLETETKKYFKDKADDVSIASFSKNLEKLLLAPPLGNKVVLAIDPGFKSGCKIVVLDSKGDFLHNENIYPHAPQNETSKASAKYSQLIEMYKVEAIAVGDGTASRETESFIKKIKFKTDMLVYLVREDGASIYSASKVAREEFPQFDVTVRGAISIGRRLMDPLAELVKIDPKSLGVGQYQHDVNQVKLKEELDRVVLKAVNRVGVDLNTASKYLLSYVSGLGPSLAEKIVKHREENGLFKSRQDLKKVERMGEKAFQQAAGFLRIKSGSNLLDNSAVHPENYDFVEHLAKESKLNLQEVVGNKNHIDTLRQNFKNSSVNIGEYTAQDIFVELLKPGLDPREKVRAFEFSPLLKTINDLQEGMVVNGVVTNVTEFGAFVNIGIKENGLIHKTQLSDEYVANPNDIISIHEQIKVKVLSIDSERKRIGLTLRNI